ncbi:hypothetical protein GH714_034182 [Hevea brasiliensis]|uniref:Uncharacterized protein n=1 Tax=Hevea brasiliensis TaxID=3981 RepID=A0A6A6NC09_HEVBR|nr:hypothetical protein GH714_034182 [Hevea brasiliensis]
MEGLVVENKDWLNQWLYDIKPWQALYTPSDRLIWLRLQGIPLNSWSSHFFQWVGNLCGTFIAVHGANLPRNKLDAARILLLIDHQGHIDKIIAIDIDNTRDHIKAFEESCSELYKQFPQNRKRESPSSSCEDDDGESSNICADVGKNLSKAIGDSDHDDVNFSDGSAHDDMNFYDELAAREDEIGEVDVVDAGLEESVALSPSDGRRNSPFVNSQSEDPLASLPVFGRNTENLVLSPLNIGNLEFCSLNHSPTSSLSLEPNPLALVPYKNPAHIPPTTWSKKLLKLSGISKQRRKCKLINDLMESCPKLYKGGKRRTERKTIHKKQLKDRTSPDRSKSSNQVSPCSPSNSDINHVNSRIRSSNPKRSYGDVPFNKLYCQPNHARLFEIEYEIARINQNDRDVQTFHSELIGLWIELDMVSMSLVDKLTFADLNKERDRNRVLQFLMKLRPEFENIRATIVNSGITDFDSVLGELLREETRLQTQANLDAKTNNVDTIFFASRSRPAMKKMTGENGTVQCRFCGEIWHIQSHCKKRNVCNYCKKKGHVIL